MLGIDWLAVNALSAAGDPLARVLHGSPRTDVYAAYERIRARRRRSDLIQARPAYGGVPADLRRDPARSALRRPADPRCRHHAEPHRPRPRTAQRVPLELDPPQHTRLRRLTAPAFRPKLIREFAPVVEEVLAEILDRLEGRDRFDLMSELASIFPIAVISRLLGIPAADATHFAEIGMLVGQSLDGVRTVRQAQELRRASLELEVLFRRLADERRAEPRDDVISLLANAEDGGELTSTDLVATCGLLLVAGFETTVNLIGNGFAALQGNPDTWRRLAAEPALAAAAVEETLRFDSPVQLTVRFAGEDLDVDGRPVERGGVIAILLAAANRDPAAYPEPARFSLDRSGQPEHLAFSSGIHYCLGAPLARLEGELALRALVTRWPELALLPGARRRPGATIRGYASLPVTIR